MSAYLEAIAAGAGGLLASVVLWHGARRWLSPAMAARLLAFAFTLGWAYLLVIIVGGILRGG